MIATLTIDGGALTMVVEGKLTDTMIDHITKSLANVNLLLYPITINIIKE